MGLEPYELLNGTSPERLQAKNNVISGGSHSQSPAPAPSMGVAAPTPAGDGAFSLVKDLPIVGRAQGGPDGNLIINEDPIDWTFRPQDLKGVSEAFAIYVTGDSMAPKYEDGDLIYIHPNRPPRKGRYVVIETNDNRGLVKKYLGWDGDMLVLEQFNPAKEIRIDKQDVKRVMPVIGSMDA